MSKLFVDEIQPKTTGAVINAKGMVIQVKQSILTTTWTSATSSTAFEDTPLNVIITPQSTNSKILITGMINSGGQAGTHYDYKVVRNGADILLSTETMGNKTKSHIHHYVETAVNAYNIFPDIINLLDEPSSTSALTYTLQGGTPNSTSYITYLNRSARTDNNAWNALTVSTLTAMEIGG